MIRISDKSECCGCSACVSACPVQCIVMRRDREGFDYPVADPDRCIRCGKCEDVCPVISPLEAQDPLDAYAVRLDEFLEGSSSGGVFPALAREIIQSGGVVFGAVMNNDMTVGHVVAERMDQVELMRGSKYVQSDPYATYEEAASYLAQGRRVLYSGTPCQIAGLNKYIGSKSQLLVTVDVACHGVPSPGLWEKYINSLEEISGVKLDMVRFKDKSQSCKVYQQEQRTSYSHSGQGHRILATKVTHHRRIGKLRR